MNASDSWFVNGTELGGVLASHTAPTGAAGLLQHSCHFVLLKVGLPTQVEKGKGQGERLGGVERMGG